MIHLDTSFLIRALVPGSREGGALRGWLCDGDSINIGASAWTEFLCGPVSADTVASVARLLGEPKPYGGAETETTARLFNRSGRRRGTLVDCMIAATAMRDDASLATANPADFRRFVPPGLELADY